jgi:hypothetical protein
MRLPIHEHAREAARKALNERSQLNNSQKFGLDKRQADKLGIASGVERAKQIIRNDTLPEEDGRKVARFYSRFKNKRGKRAEGALDLWGGRKFGKEAYDFYYGE